MSEIPEDIMNAALEAVENAASEEPCDPLVMYIGRAILAERERCANVVRTMPLLKTSGLVGSEISMCEMGQEAAYEAAADAIMKGTTNGK